MFGGWAFLLHGNLLCGVRRGSLMLRVGPAYERWALTMPGVVPVLMRGRRMHGYVRVRVKLMRTMACVSAFLMPPSPSPSHYPESDS